jgi:hypothetical protein
VRRFFPEQWERFRLGVPEADRDGDLVAAYARLMENPDPACGTLPRPPGWRGRTR